ncbi:hypothetical protein [Salegentibacter salinarum]|nr:hypothetical protein [Salegentibacter salinarum]
MKSITHLLTIMLVISLTVSCSKDNSEEIGNDLTGVNATYNMMVDYNDKGSQIPELTESNYLFESDLYTFYLKTEINKLETKINNWAEIAPKNPKYEEVQADIKKAKESLIGLYENLENIKPLIGIKPPRKPRPCLGKDNDAIPCINPKRFSLLVTTDDVEILSLSLSDSKNNTIAVNNSKETHQPLPEYKNLLYYTSVQLKEIQPMVEATLSIQKQVKGKTFIYKVPVMVRQD